MEVWLILVGSGASRDEMQYSSLERLRHLAHYIYRVCVA
jgi:hypothetical protein